MAFQVDFTRRAHRDLAEQLEWWGQYSRSAAEQWRDHFLTTVITTLETHPERYAEAEEAVDLQIDLRVLTYGRRRQVYRVLFTLESNHVVVHRVRHAAQNRLTTDDI